MIKCEPFVLYTLELFASLCNNASLLINTWPRLIFELFFYCTTQTIKYEPFCFTCSGTLLFVMMLHYSFILDLIWFLNCLCIAPHEEVWTFGFTYSGTLLAIAFCKDASLLIYAFDLIWFLNFVYVCATAKTWKFLSTGFRGLCMVQPLTAWL